MRNDYAHYRLAGDYTFDDAVTMVDGAIRWCREKKVARLLVDIKELSGFPSPSLIDRFEFATRWAESAAGRVAVSFVAPPALIDPEKIGVLMATNRGMQAEVFTDETDAIIWIQTRPAE